MKAQRAELYRNSIRSSMKLGDTALNPRRASPPQVENRLFIQARMDRHVKQKSCHYLLNFTGENFAGEVLSTTPQSPNLDEWLWSVDGSRPMLSSTLETSRWSRQRETC